MMFTYLNGLRIRVMMLTFLSRLPMFTYRNNRFPCHASGAVQTIGRNGVHLTKMICLFRTMRLASVDRTAFKRGSRNPPRCTISFCLEERDTRHSETLRSAAMCFCSLRVSQPVSLILPFRMIKTQSLIKLTISLLQFEIIALRKFGSAFFSTCRV